MTSSTEPAAGAIWTPDPSSDSAIADFARQVGERRGVDLRGYPQLWRWSIEHLEDFWSEIWRYFSIDADIDADGDCSTVLADARMPGASWFPQVRLNYAEHALRPHAGVADTDVAVTEIGEDGATKRVTWAQLREQVASVALWLREQDVQPGDRVVGYLPNTAAAIVALLATAGVGAVWSACAQDYAAEGAARRFAQLEPVVLFAADGYRWNGRVHDRREEVRALQEQLPSLRQTVHVPAVGLGLDAGAHADPSQVSWSAVTATRAAPRFERVAFDAALWVLFSSGTTGRPKGIVHGHGGVTLEHLKLLALHLDVGPGRPLFWYTSTNWMMWNVVASGLLVGAPIVVYDGSPAHPEPGRLWEIAAEHRVDLLGVSPGYLATSERAGLRPGRDLDLSALRTVAVTGAPLGAAAYHWTADAVSRSVQVASTSGGTDVVSGFAGSAPTTPVWPGEISAPLLGVDLQAWDAAGRSVVDEVGELVVTQPMPSMPVCFWDDPDGARYRDAYFATYPGVWRHGDWLRVTKHGSLVVSGRSDSTLNRHGVRLGSADIYEVVDTLPEIAESLVIGAELPGDRYWLVLFVVLADAVELTDARIAAVKAAIAAGASPRHVPDDVIAVAELPHTRTGKKLEVPVKRIIQGHPVDQVASRDSVDDFAALGQFEAYAGGPAPS